MTKTDHEEIGCSVENAFELNDRPSKTKLEEKVRLKNQLLKKELFMKLNNQLEAKLHGTQSNLHLEFIDQLITYFQDCKNAIQSNEGTLDLIPTGIISIKSSTTEHEFIFNQIIDKLNRINKNKLIYLQSTSKLTVQNIVGLIYEKILDKDLLNKLGVKNERRYLRDLKFQQFVSIYSKEIGNEPFILLIDDLVSFNCEFINLLFRFLHSYIAKLPVIVFCGLSQTFVTLQSLFKPMVLSQLTIRSFSTKMTLDIMEQVFYSTFIDTDLDLQFGSKLLTHFQNTFNSYDFSVKKIEHLAKLAIWFFCYRNEFAYLNGSVEDFKEKIKKMDKNSLEKLKKLPSLSEFSQENEAFKRELVEQFIRMSEVKSDFLNEIKAFYALISETRADDSFCNLFIKFLTDSQKDFDDEWRKWSKFLDKFSLDDWRERIEKISEDNQINQTKLAIELRKQLDKLDALNDESFTEKNYKINVKNRKTKEELQRELLTGIKDVGSPVQIWKSSTIKIMKSHLSDLENPSVSYLNEIFYYDNLDEISQLNLVSFRETLIKRLEDPNSFAKLVQQTLPNELKSFKPDLCTAFRLFRESQYKINLADFLESGIVCLEQNEIDKKDNSRKRRKLEVDKNEITFRFLTAIHDLGYFGFFEKQSKSNDIIVKLVH